jgi:hypothetical protein
MSKLTIVKNPVYQRHLSCDLSDKELLDIGNKLGRRQADLAALEDQFKSVKEDFKNRITSAETDVKSLGRLLRDKFEFRDTNVQDSFDYVAEEVLTVRMDTGEIINRRDITAKEMQMQLDFQKKAEKGAAAETAEAEGDVNLEEAPEVEAGEPIEDKDFPTEPEGGK